MTNLQRKPFGTHGKVHEITPQSAGWRFVGFSLYRLRAGDFISEVTSDREVILVMVEGKAQFRANDKDWGVFGDRMDVFEKTPPHCLYLPNDSAWEAIATTDCTIAVCSAPGKVVTRPVASDPMALRSRRAARPPTSGGSTTSPWRTRTIVTACWSPRSSHRKGTGRPILAIAMTKTTIRVSLISKKLTITGSIRIKVLGCNASIPMTARWTNPWRSKVMMSFSCPAVTIPAGRSMATKCTTLTLWPAPAELGASNQIPNTSGSLIGTQLDRLPIAGPFFKGFVELRTETV